MSEKTYYQTNRELIRAKDYYENNKKSLINSVPNAPTCTTCPTCPTCPRAKVYFTDQKFKDIGFNEFK